MKFADLTDQKVLLALRSATTQESDDGHTA
jgi:hypothetical protein